jgi:hypothetical protein
LRDHAAELLATVPDLILANSTPVTTALREQSRSVPIVFTQVTDPVGQGLVPNLAHPGGNLTGFTSFEFSIGTKWLEALRQTAPRVTRVALVFNPQSANLAAAENLSDFPAHLRRKPRDSSTDEVLSRRRHWMSRRKRVGTINRFPATISMGTSLLI